MLRTLCSDEITEFIALYKHLVDQGYKPRLDDWFEYDNTKAAAEVGRLLVLLDYIARHGFVPEPHARTLFIEWDEREFDDSGAEW